MLRQLELSQRTATGICEKFSVEFMSTPLFGAEFLTDIGVKTQDPLWRAHKPLFLEYLAVLACRCFLNRHVNNGRFLVPSAVRCF